MNKHLIIRKSHRYLGVFIGIQFLAWTVSGLYFSWTNIDSVHGDDMRRPVRYLANNLNVVAPTDAINKLREVKTVDSIHSVHLIRVVNKPVYQIAYFSGHSGHGVHAHVHYALADAETGQLRAPLQKEEAIAIAQDQVLQGAELEGVNYIERTGKHHEYRESPVPAWAVTFNNPACTIYVSAEKGTFQTIRHSQWRIFDFLWMTHTMDYESRDNMNNWLLRAFSVFGLITVISGFALYFISSRTFKKVVKK